MDFCDFKEKFTFLREKNIYVGFSGGADSLALLVLLAHFREAYNFKLTAIHFEHGIRGEESLQDMEFCRDFCLERGIELQIYSLNVPQKKLPSESCESCARRLRQAHFREIIQNNGDNIESLVVLGHHADDMAENLLLRIFRGGNVSSLVNLRELVSIDDICYYRPLLSFSKGEVLQFLAGQGINQYCSDSTNSDSSYLRNFVRNEIFGKLKNNFSASYEGIIRSYEALLDDAEVLEKYAKIEYEKIRASHQIENEFYRKLDKALLIRVLRYYISSLIGESFIPNYAFMDKFLAIVNSESPSGKKIQLNSEYNYICTRNKWELVKCESLVLEDVEWDYISQNEVVYNNHLITAELLEFSDVNEQNLTEVTLLETYLDAELIGEKLILSSRKDGDTILRFAGKSATKVKKLIIDKKLTETQKRNLIFFRNENGEIIFISGLEHGKIGKISKKSRKIIRIRVEKI